MAEATIDRLEIEIEASATGAEEKLNKVISCLEGVSTAAAKVLHPLKTMRTAIDTGQNTKQLRTLQKAMENVSSGAAAKMQRSIRKAVPSFDATKFSKSLERVDAEITKTDEKIQPLQNTIAYLKMPVSGASAIGKLGTAEEVGEVEEKLAELQRVRSLLSEQRSTLWADMEKQTAGAGTSVEFEKAIKDASIFREILDRLSLTVQSVGAKMKELASNAVSLVGRGFEVLGNAIKKTGAMLFAQFIRPVTSAISVMTRLRKSFGRIAFYRTIKAALRTVTEGFKEGFENFKAFSDAAGNEFSVSMKNITANAQYLKNSLGALAAPLVNSIAPAIDYLIDKFVSLINVINMLMSLLSGRGTYFRAVRGASTATISMGNAMDKVKVASVSAAESMDKIAVASLDAKSAVDGIAVASVGAVDGIALAANTASEVKDSLSEVGTAANSSGELGKNLSSAADSAKEIRRYLIGIDELNVMPDQSFGGGGGGGGAGGGLDVGGMFEEVPLPGWLGDVKAAIDAGKWSEAGELLADKVNGLIDSIDGRSWGQKLGEKIQHGIEFSLGFLRRIHFETVGREFAQVINGLMDKIKPEDLGALLAQKLRIAIDLAYGFVTEGGLEWEHLGDWLGNVVNGWFAEIKWDKFGVTVSEGIKGVLKSVNQFFDTTDFEQIGRDIGTFIANLDWKTIFQDSFAAAGNIAEALGEALKGVFEEASFSDVAGAIGLILSVKLVPKLLSAILHPFKTISALLKKDKDTEKIKRAIQEVTSGTQGITVETQTLSAKMKELVKELGWGIVIIAEVAAAAALVVGAVWLLGKELEQVGIAWEPVIENAKTVAIAMGVGAGLLAGIGAVTALLGTGGLTLATSMGVGILILAEVGAATAVFVGEVWALGWGLDKVREAWEPVIENRATIEKAIEDGAIALAAVGAVTALLGAITVGTGFTIPLAIGAGTAVLMEIGGAAALLIDEVKKLAQQLTDELAPAMSGLNEVLPDLASDTEDFKSYMAQFAQAVTDVAGDMVISGLAQALESIVEIFTGDPLANFRNEVQEVYEVVSGDSGLYATLVKTNPVLYNLEGAIQAYKEAVGKIISILTAKGEGDATNLGQALVSDAKEVGGAIVDWVDGWFDADISSAMSSLAKDAQTAYDSAVKLNEKMGLAVGELETTESLITSYNTLITTINGLIGGSSSILTGSLSLNMEEVGSGIVLGIASGMESAAGEIASVLDGIENNVEIVLIAIDSFVASKMQEINQVTYSYGDIIEGTVKTATDSIEKNVNTKLNAIKTKVTTTNSTISRSVSTSWDSIKSKITSVCDTVENKIKTTFDVAMSKADSVFPSIADTISKNMSNAASSVENGISRMKKALDVTLPQPRLKLPHVTVSGSFSLEPPSAPKFSVSWYKKAMDKAMLLDGATIFGASGGKLLGGGEAGREVVAGEDHLLKLMKKTVTEAFAESDRTFKFSPSVFADYSPQFAMNGPSWEDATDNTQGQDDASREKQTMEIINAINAMGQRMIEAYNHKNQDIYIDRHKIGGIISREQNRQARITGHRFSGGYGL